MNTDFPIEMLNYFKEHHEIDDDKLLKKMFKKSDSLKNAYLNWVELYPDFVEQSPRLLKAKQIASKPQITQYISEKLNIRKSEKKKSKFNRTDQSFIKLPYELFSAKLITQDQMLDLHQKIVSSNIYPLDDKLKGLSLSDYFPNKRTCLFNKEILSKSLAFLETLENKSLIEVLSVKDEKGQTILFCPELFKMLIPLFMKNDQSVFIELITLADENGNIPLHYGIIFQLAIEIIESFIGEHTPYIITHLLSIKNKDGNTILHSRGNLEIAMPLMKTMQLTQLRRTISIGNNNNETALHNPERDSKISDLLRAFDLTTLLEILSKKNSQGNTPLHYEPIFKMAMSFLKDRNLNKQEYKAIISALCIKNNEDDTPLHFEKLFRHAIYFLNELKVKYLEDCLVSRNKLNKNATQTLYDVFNTYKLESRIKNEHQQENLERYKIIEEIHSKLVNHRLRTTLPESAPSLQLTIEK